MNRFQSDSEQCRVTSESMGTEDEGQSSPGAPPKFRRVPILNVHLDDMSMNDLLAVRDGMFMTLHADMLLKLQQDRDFYEMLPMFQVITCDSQVLYFLMKLIRRPVQERVSGSDYFPAFCERYRDDPSATIFMCGAGPGIAERAAAKVNSRAGRDIVVGFTSPRFDAVPDGPYVDELAAQINASGATVLMMGMGSPRQERFIAALRPKLTSVRLYMPLGGTIDYEAGAVKRPPAWVTKAGLEWAWRVLHEPRRRWRRYLLDDPKVLYLVLEDVLGRYRNPFGTPDSR